MPKEKPASMNNRNCFTRGVAISLCPLCYLLKWVETKICFKFTPASVKDRKNIGFTIWEDIYKMFTTNIYNSKED